MMIANSSPRPPGALTAFLLAVLYLASVPGCSNAGSSSADATAEGKLKIVCTVGMVADIVREVAGDHAVVTNIIGEGVDPHTYAATASDVKTLLGADIVFYSGLHLEGKMSDSIVKVSRNKAVYRVTELIDVAYLLEPEEFAGQYDPHVWMDVAGWMKAVEAVRDALSEETPENAESYRENAAAYLEELQALDIYVRQSISSVPQDSRVLITAHDAFNYFGRAYGMEVLGVQGISTTSEAGVNDVNRLVDLIVDRNIQAVFVETSVADKQMRGLIESAESRGRDVRIGGSLFSDAMGRPGTYEGTYIGMIDHNATIITRALGGEAPARGFQGKLGSDEG